MNINHIIDKDAKISNAWTFYGRRERKRIESPSERYELRIYTDKNDTRYRYYLDSYKENLFRNILGTDSKEEMKMTLDLMGLRFEQVNIFMLEKSTGKTNVTYSLIDLNGK